MRNILLVLTLLMAGCTTYSNNHYSLMDKPHESDILQISQEIKQIIETIVHRYGLSNAMTDNESNSVLMYYSSGGDSALRVGVRLDAGKVVLDSFQYRSGAGDSPEYKELREELVQALMGMKGVELAEIDGPAI